MDVVWAAFALATVVLVHIWLYGIRIYGVAMASHGRPLFNTGHPKIVALTIDDVPWHFRPFGMTTSIAEIGALLEQHGCSATLLVIGSYLKEAPADIVDVLKRLHRNGTVEYANHGYTNSKHASLSMGALGAELVETERVIRSRILHGERNAHRHATPFYRPGCGLFHKAMLECAAARGYTTVLGDVYSFDPHIPVPLLHLIHIMITMRPGGIIILHDRPWTPALLRWLLPLLKWRGYRVEMLSKAMGRSRAVPAD